jgi:hypothetical protein
MILCFTVGPSYARAKVRALPPSAFPELPNDVVGELEHRACQIPQIQRHKRSNVIQAELFKAGQTDWAVLCATKQATTLLVFANGAGQQPMEVERRGIGSAERWSIVMVNPQFMLDYARVWKPRRPLPELDHQGILSATGPRDPSSGRFSDSAAEDAVLYFDSGAWTKLVTVVIN